jgi:teichoic acid transport system ATP-binding protein
MAEDERVPAVIASHVDVVYRVFGGGRAKPVSSDDDDPGTLLRLLTDRRPQVGVREVHAVKDVSFVAYRGESIGIVGRNGSGKSTLLRAVAGLIPPTNGAIWVNGRAALLGVNAVLMRKLSGARNIMIGGQALGLTKAEVRARYDDIVEFADIGDFINLPMSSYSSGMAARLRFAISTAAVPDILVVDEALSTGDAQFRARANERIQQIRESAGTVFMVSHNNATIKQQCTRALWMDDGHLIMDGPAAEVVDAYAAKYGPKKKAAAPKPKPRPQQQKQPAAEGDGEAR